MIKGLKILNIALENKAVYMGWAASGDFMSKLIFPLGNFSPGIWESTRVLENVSWNWSMGAFEMHHYIDHGITQYAVC